MIYYAVLMLVFFYIVIYVFMIKQQYLDKEKTTGWILTKVVNPAHDKDGNPWDIMDSVTNPGEQGAVFVPTKVLVTRGQVQEGYCESKLHPCSAPADCDIGDEALQKPECSNGFCVRRQWCPAQSEGAPETTTHYVDTGGYDVWFQTNLHYHKFMLDVSTTDEPEPRKYPMNHPNTFPIHDILRMANIDPKDIKENGAIVAVNLTAMCVREASKRSTSTLKQASTTYRTTSTWK